MKRNLNDDGRREREWRAYECGKRRIKINKEKETMRKASKCMTFHGVYMLQWPVYE